MIFYGVSNCQLIHSLLFSCLRALFGLSVVAILICICSLMLVYQLLSHQKKKKYLQQLEIRRRFHVQSRVFGSHSSHPSFVTTHMFGPNRNNSLRHMAYGYCHDVIANGWTLPPHSYDNLDSRSYNRSFEDDIQSNVGTTNRSHSWTNWLNWSRNQVSASNNLIPNQRTNRRFFNFFRRNSNNNGENPNGWQTVNNQTFLPPHVFIPRIGSGGLTGLPPHLTRYRDSNNRLRRTLLTSMSRRTRSNDGIFQNMNVHNIPIDNSSYNPNASSSTNIFALWGPPPPYTCSQPQSLNRINTICNNINHPSSGQHCRESSVPSEVMPASKMSTPQSERRLRCNAFSSEGIRLKVEGSDRFYKPESKGSCRESCVVEIHVPYSEEQHNHLIHELEELRESHKNSKLSFNTMPSMKRNEQHFQTTNPFKSLSNIPITFPNGFGFENKTELSDSELESNKSKVETIQKVYSKHFQQKSSSSSSTLNSTSNSSSEMTSNVSTFANTDVSFSGNSLPVDPPTDYKSTIFIQTLDTHSSPLTDKTSNNLAERQVFNGEKQIVMNGTQSMPNLSIIPISSSLSTSTRTHPNLWDLHRIPSSGNTSTSQDLADYELELDEESIKFVADFPNDCLKTKLNSNSFDSSKSGSQTDSITPELIKPPTPFNNQDYSEGTTSTATLSSLSDNKPELIINITGIEV